MPVIPVIPVMLDAAPHQAEGKNGGMSGPFSTATRRFLPLINQMRKRTAKPANENDSCG